MRARFDYRWRVLLALLACSQPEPPPDVLLVVLDTVRADALSAYGNPRPTSPQVEAVASAGVRFADVTAPGSWTWPSHASLFTGLDAWEHGARMPQLGESIASGFPPMREDVPTLAGRFAEAGYRTASLSANCLLTPELGLVRDFADARCLDAPGAVEDEVKVLLAEDDPRPLFLFVNLMPAHAPYDITHARWSAPHEAELDPAHAEPWIQPYLKTQPPGVDLGRAAEGYTGIQHYLRGELDVTETGWTLVRDLYEGEVVEADARLNRVLKSWASSRDGVVAVTSDHGEAFGEHGKIDHRANVYPEVLAVPLVLAGPGVPVGTTIEQPIPLLALHDTLLTLAGLEASTRGLVPVMAGGTWSEPIRVVAWPDPYRAEKVGGDEQNRLTLVRDSGDALVLRDRGAAELYVAGDWSNDVAATHPARVEELRALAAVEVHQTRAGPLDAATRNNLKALGYVE